MLGEPQPLRLGLQLGLVRAAASHQETHVLDALDHARQGVERQLEALLVDQPPDEQHELLLWLRRTPFAAPAGPPLARNSSGSIPFGITAIRRSSMPKMSATCPRM